MSEKELWAIAWTGAACTAVATFTEYAKMTEVEGRLRAR